MNVNFQASVALPPRMHTMYVYMERKLGPECGRRKVIVFLFNNECSSSSRYTDTSELLSMFINLQKKKLLNLLSLLLKMCSQALCSYGYKEISLINRC